MEEDTWGEGDFASVKHFSLLILVLKKIKIREIRNATVGCASEINWIDVSSSSANYTPK